MLRRLIDEFSLLREPKQRALRLLDVTFHRSALFDLKLRDGRSGIMWDDAWSVHQRLHVVVVVLSLVALMTLATGCGAATVADGPSQANFITLKDTSPGQLNAHVMVTVGGYDTATRNTTTVDVSFLVGNRLVRMVGDEHVACNSTSLQRYAGSFELRVATSTLAGKDLTCTYTSGSSSGTLAFTMPAAPVILAPHDGSSVTRSARTTVSYRVADGIVPAVVATGAKDKVIASPEATNASQATLNTSAFAAGSGQITLTQEMATIAAQNNGFKTLLVQTSAITMIAVMWA